MEIINTLTPSPATISNLISGLVSSAIFLLVLTLLKPRIKICDGIALEHNSNGAAGQTDVYSIKIVNKSIFFKVYDIQIRAWTAKVQSSTNADDIWHESIKLRKDYQWVIHRLKAKHILQDLFLGDTRLESRTDYAAQFSTYENLNSMIAAGSYITIEVIAKHSLTGFSRVISKNYKHSNNIQSGTFHSGNSCKIKP